MSTITIEVYDAFISAGADEQKARSAAQAINERDNELATKADIKSEIKSLRDFMYFGFGLTCAGIGFLVFLIYDIVKL